jgi:hypothetical protein
MSGSKINGPALAITGGVPTSSIPTSYNPTTNNNNNTNGTMNTNIDYVSKMFMIFKYYIKFYFLIESSIINVFKSEHYSN